MNKKPYQAPAIKKVRLEIKNAVLAVCHNSPNLTPRAGTYPNITPCRVTVGCYNPPPIG